MKTWKERALLFGGILLVMLIVFFIFFYTRPVPIGLDVEESELIKVEQYRSGEGYFTTRDIAVAWYSDSYSSADARAGKIVLMELSEEKQREVLDCLSHAIVRRSFEAMGSYSTEDVELELWYYDYTTRSIARIYLGNVNFIVGDREKRNYIQNAEEIKNQLMEILFSETP